MRCIITKQLPETNTKPARIKASIYGGTITCSRPMNAVNDMHAHIIVAQKLLKKMGYNENANMYRGTLPTDDGYGFIVEYEDIYRN